MISFHSAVVRVSGVDPVGATSAASPSAAMSGAKAMSGPFPPGGVGAAEGVGVGAGGAGGAGAAGGVAGATPASAESAARFRQMLDNATLNVQSNPNASQGPSAISSIVDSQDAAFNKIRASVETFQQNAGTMDQREFTAQMVRMQFEMADTMAKIELGVGFAQGGKGAVQNLMKNQ